MEIAELAGIQRSRLYHMVNTNKRETMKIKDLIEIEKHFAKNKKTPCDIAKFLEDETVSMDGTVFSFGDMHLTHYIRRQLKDERTNDETISKLNKKIRELKHFINIQHVNASF